jgi:hypothetical protein
MQEHGTGAKNINELNPQKWGLFLLARYTYYAIAFGDGHRNKMSCLKGDKNDSTDIV